MVDEHGDSMPVDYPGAVADAEEIGGWGVLIFLVGLLLADSGAGIFDNARSLFYWVSCIAASGVDSGGADDQSHEGFIGEYSNVG